MDSFIFGQIFDSLICFDVDFDVFERAILMMNQQKFLGEMVVKVAIAYLLGKFIGMPAVCVHVSERRWGTPITEQMHEFMNTFRVSDMKTGERLEGCSQNVCVDLLPELSYRSA